MTITRKSFLGMLLSAAVTVFLPALAHGKGKGKAKGKAKGKSAAKSSPGGGGEFLPPGLEKRDTLPPGLLKKQGSLPHGLAKGRSKPPGLEKRDTLPPGLQGK